MTPLLSTPYPDLRGDLDYFLSMQESQPVDRPDHSAQKWDQRADAWEQEVPKAQKGDARVRSTMAYLEARGLLRPEYEIGRYRLRSGPLCRRVCLPGPLGDRL